MAQLGRILIILGIVLLLLGLALSYSNLFSFLRLGRLPGDISIKREGYSFYFPLATCILISLVISLIFYLFPRLDRISNHIIGREK
jgi:hypothetical protein